MNDDDLTEASEQIQALRAEVRADLAAELGGNPEEYRAENYFRDLGGDTDEAVPDGGDSTQDDGE